MARSRMVVSNRPMALVPVVVYVTHMARTNIDIDDKACAEVMRRYRLKTKRESVNLALRRPGRCAGLAGRVIWTRCAPTALHDPDRHIGVDRVSPRHRVSGL